MAEPPEQPDAEDCEHLLAVLADLVAQGGAAPLLAPPVALGPEELPETWRPTLRGVRQLLARLAWHAGLSQAIEVSDARMGAPPTERRPPTQLDTTDVSSKRIAFTLGFLGSDDVPGTFAHEVGVAYAALHRPTGAEPYREPAEAGDVQIDPDRDLDRGSIAAVYLGLGVLATNAAFQQYTAPGRFNGGYDPHEYDVLRAGYAPMSALAYLLAVQAVLRGQSAPPPGLQPPQRDEVVAWIAALRDDGAELRTRLGIGGDDAAGAAAHSAVLGVAWRASDPRTPIPALPGAGKTAAAADDADEALDPTPRSVAFRWRSNRGGVGFLAGTVLGFGLASLIASHAAGPIIVLASAGAGVVAGRRVYVPRCTACASVVPMGAPTCPSCGAILRGDILKQSDRLEAEERLAESTTHQDSI